MKKLDRYYFFLFKALSEPNANPDYRYFLIEDKEALIMKQNEELNDDERERFYWVELPKLSYIKKKNFLIRFAIQHGGQYLEEINEIIYGFKEDSSFDLVNKFKKIDLGLAFQFEMEKGSFLHQGIDEEYRNLNLNENMVIDFSQVQKGKDN